LEEFTKSVQAGPDGDPHKVRQMKNMEVAMKERDLLKEYRKTHL